MKKLVLICAILMFSASTNAKCPSADLSGDCKVNFDDLFIMASEWLTTYDANDFADMASQWGDDGAFVTTWDTSLDEGTKIALALGGDVDATIDWGDGTIETVTDSGPHHDYGVDGVYTISVTGRVTKYDSFGDDSWSKRGWSEKMLISVDSWGQVGFTSMSNAFFGCWNLVSVPDTSQGLEDVTSMSGMFRETFAFNQDISGWDTSNVTYMEAMFMDATSFNQDISKWDTSSVHNMLFMFFGASSFNQDLSGWCVRWIYYKPLGFDQRATSWVLARPVWGTCP